MIEPSLLLNLKVFKTLEFSIGDLHSVLRSQLVPLQSGESNPTLELVLKLNKSTLLRSEVSHLLEAWIVLEQLDERVCGDRRELLNE